MSAVARADAGPLLLPSGPMPLLLPLPPLSTRIKLIPANRDWLNAAATKYHYMHRGVSARAIPFGWRVVFDGHDTTYTGEPCGFIMFASVHFTKLKDEFGYPGLPTKWQVLSLARLWLSDELPSMSETCVIGKSHKLVQQRWLEVHPPRFIDLPYHILKIISFADNEFHEGKIYKAANYREAGKTKSMRRHETTNGIEMDGHTLTRWIFDLPRPNWKLGTPQSRVDIQLPLFGGLAS